MVASETSRSFLALSSFSVLAAAFCVGCATVGRALSHIPTLLTRSNNAAKALRLHRRRLNVVG